MKGCFVSACELMEARLGLYRCKKLYLLFIIQQLSMQEEKSQLPQPPVKLNPIYFAHKTHKTRNSYSKTNVASEFLAAFPRLIPT